MCEQKVDLFTWYGLCSWDFNWQSEGYKTQQQSDTDSTPIHIIAVQKITNTTRFTF